MSVRLFVLTRPSICPCILDIVTQRIHAVDCIKQYEYCAKCSETFRWSKLHHDFCIRVEVSGRSILISPLRTHFASLSCQRI